MFPGLFLTFFHTTRYLKLKIVPSIELEQSSSPFDRQFIALMVLIFVQFRLKNARNLIPKLCAVSRKLISCFFIIFSFVCQYIYILLYIYIYIYRRPVCAKISTNKLFLNRFEKCNTTIEIQLIIVVIYYSNDVTIWGSVYQITFTTWW